MKTILFLLALVGNTSAFAGPATLAQSVFDVNLIGNSNLLTVDVAMFDLDDPNGEKTMIVRFYADSYQHLVATDPHFSGTYECGVNCARGRIFIRHRSQALSRMNGSVTINFFNQPLVAFKTGLNQYTPLEPVEREIAHDFKTGTLVMGGTVMAFRVNEGFANPFHIHVPIQSTSNLVHWLDITGSNTGPKQGLQIAYSNASGIWNPKANVVIYWNDSINLVWQSPSFLNWAHAQSYFE